VLNWVRLMRVRRSLPSPKESRTRGKKKDLAASKPQFREHPLFGKIPLVPRPTKIYTVEGSYEVMILDYDLDYTPKMPRGAVRASVHRQNLDLTYSAPKYFYVNESKTCVQCGRDFVFGAQEQKYWYETLKFYITASAVRCRDCRRRRRTEKGLRLELAAAKAELKRAPDAPAALLAVAEALVRYHRRFGQGKLAEAIAAARRAHKLAPRAHEALFWEGFCHIQDNREDKGRALLARYLEYPRGTKKQHDLAREAKRYLGL
jgi:hypothetical protein